MATSCRRQRPSSDYLRAVLHRTAPIGKASAGGALNFAVHSSGGASRSLGQSQLPSSSLLLAESDGDLLAQMLGSGSVSLVSGF